RIRHRRRNPARPPHRTGPRPARHAGAAHLLRACPAPTGLPQPARHLVRLDFLSTPEGGGFPWLRRVHAASTLGGWRFTDRPPARSPRSVTASPAARMFFAAFTSALAWWPQARHRNSAWLSRLFGAQCPQAWQVCDVNAGGTRRIREPW